MTLHSLFVGVAAAALLGIVSPAEAGGMESFTYSNGTYVFINPPGPSSLHTVPTSINDTGTVAGYAYIGGTVEGFTDSGGTYTYINAPGINRPGRIYTELTSINDAGTVAGYAFSIPEPATWMMMLLGFLGLGGVMRHSKRQLAIAA